MKPLLDKFPARRSASFVGIILVIGMQLAFLFTPTIGSDPYRRHERIALLNTWHKNPTAVTKAAYDEEMSRERHHHAVMAYAVTSLFIAIDTLLLYAYWRFWIRKPAG